MIYGDLNFERGAGRALYVLLAHELGLTRLLPEEGRAYREALARYAGSVRADEMNRDVAMARAICEESEENKAGSEIRLADLLILRLRVFLSVRQEMMDRHGPDANALPGLRELLAQAGALGVADVVHGVEALIARAERAKDVWRGHHLALADKAAEMVDSLRREREAPLRVLRRIVDAPTDRDTNLEMCEALEEARELVESRGADRDPPRIGDSCLDFTLAVARAVRYRAEAHRLHDVALASLGEADPRRGALATLRAMLDERPAHDLAEHLRALGWCCYPPGHSPLGDEG